jgi:hypothetical protein
MFASASNCPKHCSWQLQPSKCRRVQAALLLCVLTELANCTFHALAHTSLNLATRESAGCSTTPDVSAVASSGRAEGQAAVTAVLLYCCTVVLLHCTQYSHVHYCWLVQYMSCCQCHANLLCIRSKTLLCSGHVSKQQATLSRCTQYSTPTLAGPLPLISSQAAEALVLGWLLLPHCCALHICRLCALPAVIGDRVHSEEHPDEQRCCVGYLVGGCPHQRQPLSWPKLPNVLGERLIIREGACASSLEPDSWPCRMRNIREEALFYNSDCACLKLQELMTGLNLAHQRLQVAAAASWQATAPPLNPGPWSGVQCEPCSMLPAGCVYQE